MASFPRVINQAISQLNRELAELNFFMLRWAVIFLIIALVAGLLGFTGIMGAAASIAKFLFYLFVGICVLLFVIGIFLGKKMTR